jgi:hypothetical protein
MSQPSASSTGATAVAGRGPLALLLTGGGARGAYQVGVLRGLAKLRPALEIPILTGVSAGGINVACLAASRSGLLGGIETLNELWCSISPEGVFYADPWSLFRGAVRWTVRLGSGGAPIVPRTRGLVDTSPLWGLLRRVLDAGPDDEIPGHRGPPRRRHAARCRASRPSTGRPDAPCSGCRGAASSRGGAPSAAASRPGSLSIT